jgi:hypothetical protein
MDRHEHLWIYDGMSCCYRLRCSFPGCGRRTTVYHVKGRLPEIGERVVILQDQETIQVDGEGVEHRPWGEVLS